ncbi:putative DNA-binding protein [Paenibacillus sp. UNC451MF]|uniref:putative DNA-binding protein n=1 Tax=Paenibacillus sp. UNC451MF TaxID=1449063 RepID=UPI00048AA4D2|nr:putative DNA-binding protein [Paenibacillus sp. UNC451MF]
MTEENALMKTNRINLLFDFYEKLLTEKQQLFCKLYFHDDYSLGEIAAEFKISRQAVYEHIKRSESVLEDYELKLKLLAKHEERQQLTQKFEPLLTGLSGEEREQAQTLLHRLSNLD